MGGIVGKQRTQGQTGRAVGDAVAGPIADRRRTMGRGWQVRQMLCRGTIQRDIVRQARVTVHTADFQRDPVGAQVAFLKDMDDDAVTIGGFDRDFMQRPAVAVQNDIGGREIQQQTLQEHRPFRQPAGEIGGRQRRPGQPIATVEVDPQHAVATAVQGLAQFVHERPGHPLQEQEAPLRKRADDTMQRPGTLKRRSRCFGGNRLH